MDIPDVHDLVTHLFREELYQCLVMLDAALRLWWRSRGISWLCVRESTKHEVRTRQLLANTSHDPTLTKEEKKRLRSRRDQMYLLKLLLRKDAPSFSTAPWDCGSIHG